MKKILYLSTSLAFGGAETQLYFLAISLKQRGWDVKVVTMCAPQAFEKELIDNGIFVYSLNIPRGVFDLKAFFRFIKILQLEKPDILNTFLVHANFFGRLTRLFVRIPVLVSSARNVFEGGGIRNWWYRTTDFLCDITTQVSQVGSRRYVDEKLVHASKIAYIPNGVDMGKFRKDDVIKSRLRRELGVENAFVWLAVGRLEEEKDYSNMINAFNLIPRKTGCVLLIVGNGSFYEKIVNQVHELGLDKLVRFLGVQTDIVGLMSASDAYVMSSAWEGMPNVLLEASACELPIVATSVGANPELILDEVTGFLVPAEDSALLAKTMASMMTLPKEKRIIMGLAGRRHIQENYSLGCVVSIWEELYNSLLKKNKK